MKEGEPSDTSLYREFTTVPREPSNKHRVHNTQPKLYDRTPSVYETHRTSTTSSRSTRHTTRPNTYCSRNAPNVYDAAPSLHHTPHDLTPSENNTAPNVYDATPSLPHILKRPQRSSERLRHITEIRGTELESQLLYDNTTKVCDIFLSDPL